MQKQIFRFLSIFLPAFLFTFAACEKDDKPQTEGYFYGKTATIGNGTARAYVELDANGDPLQIGIAFNEAALENLPATDQPMTLELPAEALSKTPFKHVTFDYNPHGHEPPGIYTVPHFDAHFYKITEAEKLNIGINDADKLANNPDSTMIPAPYFPTGPVPQMGVHWVDPTSPEFNGQPFSSTFIFGAYDGNVIFYEPMVAVDFIKTKPHKHFTVRQPQKFVPAGYYPLEYCVRWNAETQQYEIALDDLTKQE